MATLLDALGGRDAIAVVVSGWCERILADPRLRPFFVETSRPRLEVHLVEFLCALLGERLQEWRGRDLRAAHTDLAISDRELDAFTGHLASTLAAAGVAAGLAIAIQRQVETVRSVVVSADEA